MTENINDEDILNILNARNKQEIIGYADTPIGTIESLIEGMGLVEEKGFDGRKVYVVGKVKPTGELILTEVGGKTDLESNFSPKVKRLMVTTTYHLARDKSKKIDAEFHIKKTRSKFGKYKGTLTFNL